MLLCLWLSAAPPGCRGDDDGEVIDKLILDALRAARKPLINPEIAKYTPDPWPIDEGASNSSYSCIIGTKAHCLCHGGVAYNVTLDTLAGASKFQITSFDSVHATSKGLGHFSLEIEGSLDDQDLWASGVARGSVSACGISPSLHGSASSAGNATGTLVLRGVANRVVRPPADIARGVEVGKKHCLQLNVTSMALPRVDLDLHNISVHIDIGVLRIPISYFVDLFKGHLTRYLIEFMQEELPSILPSHINDALPCVPVL